MAMVMAANGRGERVNPHSTSARLAARRDTHARASANLLRAKMRAADETPPLPAEPPTGRAPLRDAEQQRRQDQTLVVSAVLLGGTLGTGIGTVIVKMIAG